MKTFILVILTALTNLAFASGYQIDCKTSSTSEKSDEFLTPVGPNHPIQIQSIVDGKRNALNYHFNPENGSLVIDVPDQATRVRMELAAVEAGFQFLIQVVRSVGAFEFIATDEVSQLRVSPVTNSQKFGVTMNSESGRSASVWCKIVD